VEMPIQRWEETGARFFFSRVSATADAHPCLNKCADEPRPHRTLMITAVALRDASAVMCRVARFAWCERTQTEWRKQTLLHRIHNSARSATGERLQWQAADSENLVWAKRQIDISVIAVDYVCEVSGIFVPEAVLKCRATFLKKRLPTLRKSRADRQRIQPQGLNFYGLSNPWTALCAIN